MVVLWWAINSCCDHWPFPNIFMKLTNNCIAYTMQFETLPDSHSLSFPYPSICRYKPINSLTVILSLSVPPLSRRHKLWFMLHKSRDKCCGEFRVFRNSLFCRNMYFTVRFPLEFTVQLQRSEMWIYSGICIEYIDSVTTKWMIETNIQEP